MATVHRWQPLVENWFCKDRPEQDPEIGKYFLVPFESRASMRLQVHPTIDLAAKKVTLAVQATFEPAGNESGKNTDKFVGFYQDLVRIKVGALGCTRMSAETAKIDDKHNQSVMRQSIIQESSLLQILGAVKDLATTVLDYCLGNEGAPSANNYSSNYSVTGYSTQDFFVHPPRSSVNEDLYVHEATQRHCYFDPNGPAHPYLVEHPNYSMHWHGVFRGSLAEPSPLAKSSLSLCSTQDFELNPETIHARKLEFSVITEQRLVGMSMWGNENHWFINHAALTHEYKFRFNAANNIINKTCSAKKFHLTTQKHINAFWITSKSSDPTRIWTAESSLLKKCLFVDDPKSLCDQDKGKGRLSSSECISGTKKLLLTKIRMSLASYKQKEGYDVQEANQFKALLDESDIVGINKCLNEEMSFVKHLLKDCPELFLTKFINFTHEEKL
jgi:hypothetical protein